ncbi:MAG: PEGA domain-containing protein [bacterium]
MIGKTISHYKITERLGGGGIAVVYKAEDLKLKRTVALKFLSPEMTNDEEAKNRFKHEAQAASALDHPRIGTIYEIDETEDGQMFIAMAYYEGETLKKKIERGPVKIQEAINIVIQIASGLAIAHEQGIVHRDIKPANILITKEGFVKIVDFGLVKLAGATRITRTGTTLGTPAYMSPEQVNCAEVDHRSDIWSLGVILYELLTNRLPFEGDYEMAILYAILHEEPVRVSQYNSDIPSGMEQIINKTLEKQVANRWASVQELLHDLRKCQSSLKSDAQEQTKTEPQRDLPTPEKGVTKKRETVPSYEPHEDKKRINLLSKTSTRRITLTIALILILGILGITYLRNIQKNQISEQGYINLQSNPAGALISLNGEPIGARTPQRLGPLEKGTYEVVLTLEGFESWSKNFSIAKNDTLTHAAQLVPIREAQKIKQPSEMLKKTRGSLFVDSEPQGALVYLNDKSTGQKTPYSFNELRAGQYEVRLSLAGFLDKVTEVVIKPSEDNRIHVVLQQELLGHVNVTAVISENNTQRTAIANIFVEGQSYGQTPKIISLKSGTYKIGAKLFGYTAKNSEQQITIEGGKETTLKFEFVKNGPSTKR